MIDDEGMQCLAQLLARDLTSFSDGQLYSETGRKGPFYTILGHFGHFRQFWKGTTVQKDGQFWNPS